MPLDTARKIYRSELKLPGWFRSGRVLAKGSVFLSSGERLEAEALARRIDEIGEVDKILREAATLNGFFALVMEDDSNLLALVDRVRSIPLFYSASEDGVLVRDALPSQYAKEAGLALDKYALCEFFATGYVLSNRTVWLSWNQIEAGSYFHVGEREGRPTQDFYFRHFQRKRAPFSTASAFEELRIVEQGLKKRIRSVCAGRTAVVPLSGGYDSRYIVSLLKSAGVRDVLLYTYGRTDSHEVATAKKVAQQVEYPIHVIEYNGDKWRSTLASKSFASTCQLKVTLMGSIRERIF